MKGRQALFAVVGYAEQDTNANLTIDPTALGFTGNLKAVDVETGEELPITDNRLSFTLKKHDAGLLPIANCGLPIE